MEKKKATSKGKPEHNPEVKEKIDKVPTEKIKKTTGDAARDLITEFCQFLLSHTTPTTFNQWREIPQAHIDEFLAKKI